GEGLLLLLRGRGRGRVALVLLVARRERGGERDGDGAHDHAPVEQDVDRAARRRAIRAGAEADGEDALGEGGGPLPRLLLGAHLLTRNCWPNARSTASQNTRQAGYSAGVI